MEGDAIDFGVRLVHLLNGNAVIGVKLQMRKRVITHEDHAMRLLEWSEWYDAPEINLQTASLAAQQRMKE